MTVDQSTPPPEISLLWLPLGADGNPAVRWGGRAYEALEARREGRGRLRLFHSALRVRLDGATFVVEMAPAWGATASERGVVAVGPVGLAWLGHSRFFRYEVRRWRDGVIADSVCAVDGPVDLAASPGQIRTLLALVPQVPTLVWGRDGLGTGDMWNSNSLVSWLLTRVGLVEGLAPPLRGRAPGWDAGVTLAQRQLRRSASGSPAAREVSS